MVTDAIIGALIGVVRAVLSVIPEWAPSIAGIEAGAADVGGWAHMANGYFPVQTLFGMLMVILGYKLVLMIYRGITRVWELLPFT